jgi:peptidoglycan/LPS O-acetylase OafA/YrhL
LQRTAPNPPAARLPAYIAELDGIRAIAVLMVLFLHILDPDTQSSDALLTVAPRFLVLLIGHGWLGVDLFFVLSGFLITGILLDNPHNLENFYARRALRILPLYFLCIALMACFYSGGGPYFLLSLAFLANFAGLLGVSIPHGPDVFWSLAVEEHFYLIWPWLVRAFSRRTLAFACASIIVAEPIMRAVFVARGADVYNPSWFRFDGLASGALLAIWFRSPWASQRRSLIAAGISLAAALAITIAGLPFHILERTVAGMSLRYNQATLVYCAGMLVAISWRGTWLTAPLRWWFVPAYRKSQLLPLSDSPGASQWLHGCVQPLRPHRSRILSIAASRGSGARRILRIGSAFPAMRRAANSFSQALPNR